MKNRKYTKTKKNKGVIPQVKDKRVLYVPVACGKCMECRKAKQREWQVRLAEEVRQDDRGKFVTLTFSDEALAELSEGIKLEGYELDNEIARIAMRRYFERWRKKHGKSVKHWFVTELGQTNTERIHLHGIMWTDEVDDIVDIWKYGFADVGEYVNGATVNYISKYLSKSDELHKEYKPKMFPSAGIGKGYVERMDSKNNKYKEQETNEAYRTPKGIKLALPVYYRNKIYTEDEREKLWLQKLDKKVRYVDGVEIDVSKGDDEYFAVLKEARKKNKRLGYGDDSINWERKRYENERRNMIKKERIRRRESGNT